MEYKIEKIKDKLYLLEKEYKENLDFTNKYSDDNDKLYEIDDRLRYCFLLNVKISTYKEILKLLEE